MNASSQDDLLERALVLLDKHWGYKSFRPNQYEVIKHAMSGRDSMLLIATGGGKSIPYQICSLLMKKTVLVISPLLALMNDQCLNLNAAGIPAVALTSENSDAQAWSDAVQGKYSLIYMSPEKAVVWMDQFHTMVSADRIGLFAVDESHHISSVGHDFREEYRNIKKLREHFPAIPMMAVTATATLAVERDIKTQLMLRAPMVIRASFNRPNLYYGIRPKVDMKSNLVIDGLIDNSPAIVYCSTKKDTELVAEHYRSIGIVAAHFHSEVETYEKRRLLRDFVAGRIQVLAGTTSLGCGLDLPFLPTIIHWGVPCSLDNYVQECGRAGRDGTESRCILFYNSADLAKTRSKVSLGQKKKPNGWKLYYQIVAYLELKTCRRKLLLEYFDEDVRNLVCNNCDNCLGETDGYIAEAAAAAALAPPKKKRGSKKSSTHAELDSRIRSWRNKFAMEQGWAPFNVFPDKTLLELCDKQPMTLAALAEVNGMGPRRVDRDGQTLLRIIREYKRDMENPPAAAVKRSEPTTVLSPVLQLTLDAYMSGASPDTIGTQRNMPTHMIFDHLMMCVEKGVLLPRQVRWKEVAHDTTSAAANEISGVLYSQPKGEKLPIAALRAKLVDQNCVTWQQPSPSDWMLLKVMRARHYYA